MNTQPASVTKLRSSVSLDEPADDETLVAHATRVWRARVRARVHAVLDAGIAGLQALRRKAGGAETADESDEKPGGRARGQRSADTASDVPQPKRRLRAMMIYAAVVLAGAAAGGTISYGLFQQQVDRLLEDSQRREQTLARKTRPSADIQKALEDEQAHRAQAKARLTASIAEFANASGRSDAVLESLLGEQVAEGRRLEATLAESLRSTAAARKALAEEQARRAQAEQELAASKAEYARVLHDRTQRLAATEKQMRDGAHDATRAEKNRPHPPRAGNCTLDANNLGALKGCIDNFNR